MLFAGFDIFKDSTVKEPGPIAIKRNKPSIIEQGRPLLRSCSRQIN